MSITNTMFRGASRFLFIGFFLTALAACGGGGGGGGSSGGGSSSGATTTTISGKVTVPSSVASSKPGFAAKVMASKPHGKPGSKSYMASRKAVLPTGIDLPTGSYAKAFDAGIIYLFDANHPEWLYPVAQSFVSGGSYSLTATANAALNGNAYVDGKPIPAGKYTLYAQDTLDSGLIALQVVVNQYAGDVVGVDLVAEPSDVAPVVQTVLGASKNTNGTYTWGSSAFDSTASNYISIKKNGSVQVSFTTAMNRVSIKDNITIKTSGGTTVDGAWQVSPDWKTAVFKPAAGSLTAGNYVITVQGKDTFPNAYVKNVYGNALANTSTGYFTVVDATDTSAPNATISLYLNGSYLTSADKDNVDVVTAIRIKSDELLDVSGLSLSGTPSLGAQPTASYIGKDPLDPSYPYVYEFTLGEPLKVGTSYSVTVSGGKDLSGNAMNSPTYSFTTAPASALSGISATADTATQTLQAEVKDVFGKWVRAMNDRNLSQVQSLMTGGFVYEYDASVTGINEADTNYDSRLSLNEFSTMLQKAFDGWNACGTTVTGNVTADIIVSGSTAGMQFSLTATSSSTSQQCQQMAPKQTMYAVLQQVNGAWYVSRAAEGIDIRNKDLVLRNVITLNSPVDGKVLTQSVSSSNPVSFEWQPVQGVTSYLLLVGDDKGQGGMAVVVPSTITKVAFSDNTLYGTGLSNIADVSFLFGGNNNNSASAPTACVPSGTNTCPVGLDLLRDGATYKWEVIGLGTNTFDAFKSGTDKDVFRDITAISSLNTYQNSGTYLALGWQVQTTAGAAVQYNDWYWAYDAGSDGQIKVHVTAPLSGTLTVGVSGSGYSSQSVTLTANTAADVTLNLYQGMNWVSMSFDDGNGHTLFDNFSVTTTGGIPPAVSVVSVVDDSGKAYGKCGTAPCIDQWSYLGGTSANSVTITGQIDLTQIPGASTVGVSLWNSSGAYDYKEVSVSASGSFTISMNIYNGDNWFSFSAHDANWMYWGYSYLGINTSTGSVWVPPISVSLPAGVTQLADYGGSQDWDASTVTSNQITITGTLTSPNLNSAATYYVSSNGGWQSGNLAVSGNTFTLPVTLYNGWNWVSINDGSGNSYGVNVYTSAGAVPQRPVITSVAGQPFDINVSNAVTVDASATGCSVTVAGTLGSTAGNALTANWNGYDGITYYSDSTSATTDSTGAFTVTLPVVGNAAGYSGSYNYIDLYDSQWNWAGAVVYETSGCTYQPPVNTVGGVAVNNGDSAMLSNYGNGGYGVTLTTGQATGITVSGTNTKVGRAITGTLYSCGTTQTLQATSAADGSWSLGQFSLYNGYNSISISDGYNYSYVDVNTTNGVNAPTPVSLLSSSPAITSQNWSDCTGSGYSVDMGGGTTITVNGVLNLTPGSSGSYYANGTSTSFTTDASGNFSISVPVVNGANYMTIYDANWNSYYVELDVTNGYTPPPALKIDSPAQNATLGIGGFTATGHIDISQWSSVPTTYYAYVYDYSSNGYVYYSSNSTDIANGYQPITVDGSGNFSLNGVVLDSSFDTEVYVYAYDPVTGVSHGDDIYINNVSGYGELYWKPGTRPSASKVAKAALATEHRLKRMAAIRAKSRGMKGMLRR